jgi:HEAT repeat protein
MRVSAVFAMGRSSDDEWSHYVLDALESEEPEMRYEAARACGRLEMAGAVPKLSQLTADSDIEVKLVAVWALGQIGGPESRRVLDICVEMGDEALRDAAQEALSEIEFMEEDLELALYDYDADQGDDKEDEEDVLADEYGYDLDDLDEDGVGGDKLAADDDDDDEFGYWEDEERY